MATFKTITSADIQTTQSSLNQLVDVIQEDVSGSSTRKRYQVFVTGGVGPGVTSSLYQTVYDQDFTLQTSNAVLDATVGLLETGSTVQTCKVGQDSSGKLLFPSQSLMMREKIENYKQYAQLLLGDSSKAFYAPGIQEYDATATGTSIQTGSGGDRIEEALFINFKRLFARDELRKETFALRLYQSGTLDGSPNASTYEKAVSATLTSPTGSNLFSTSLSGSAIYADVGASSTQLKYFGGDVGYLKDTAATSQTIGQMWYDHGIAILDMGKVFFAGQHMSGAIDAMSVQGSDGNTIAAGKVRMGSPLARCNSNVAAKFIPDFMVSGSIDNIVDHLSSTRFSSGSLTAAPLFRMLLISIQRYYFVGQLQMNSTIPRILLLGILLERW